MAASSEATKKPSQKAVVELLCLKAREDKVTVEKDGVVKQVTILVLKCTNINYNNKESEITFAENLGAPMAPSI